MSHAIYSFAEQPFKCFASKSEFLQHYHNEELLRTNKQQQQNPNQILTSKSWEMWIFQRLVLQYLIYLIKITYKDMYAIICAHIISYTYFKPILDNNIEHCSTGDRSFGMN